MALFKISKVVDFGSLPLGLRVHALDSGAAIVEATTREFLIESLKIAYSRKNPGKTHQYFIEEISEGALITITPGQA